MYSESSFLPFQISFQSSSVGKATGWIDSLAKVGDKILFLSVDVLGV